jgi:hypothetical protein
MTIMTNDVTTTNFGLAASGTQDAPIMRPSQAHDRFHFWKTTLLRLRLLWPWKKANVAQPRARVLSLDANSGYGEVTATPLPTSGFSSSPSRERDGPDDQDYLRENAGRYSNIVAQGCSRQHNGNTTFIVNGPSNFYNS